MGQDKDNKLVDERQIIITQIMNEYLWQSTKQYEVRLLNSRYNVHLYY